MSLEIIKVIDNTGKTPIIGSVNFILFPSVSCEKWGQSGDNMEADR